MIFLTFRRHSSAARSYPVVRSSLESSVTGGRTGSNGNTAKALLKFLLLKRFQIRLMVCCGGGFFFFFFLFASVLDVVVGAGCRLRR